MAKLYYGNGNCSIEGDNIYQVLITYKGAIEIDDNTPVGYYIREKNGAIMISAYKIPSQLMTLNNLFDYIGEFKILKVGATQQRCTIHRVMDYSELLKSNAEDMTMKAEDLSVGYTKTGRIPKTKLKQPYIENLQIPSFDFQKAFYLEDGSKYTGDFHLHIEDKAKMTGSTFDERSKLLYVKRINSDKLISTRNLPPAPAFRRKR